MYVLIHRYNARRTSRPREKYNILLADATTLVAGVHFFFEKIFIIESHPYIYIYIIHNPLTHENLHVACIRYANIGNVKERGTNIYLRLTMPRHRRSLVALETSLYVKHIIIPIIILCITMWRRISDREICPKKFCLGGALLRRVLYLSIYTSPRFDSHSDTSRRATADSRNWFRLTRTHTHTHTLYFNILL
jgi:hypothetical protein